MRWPSAIIPIKIGVPMSAKILLIDDEVLVVKSLTRLLRKSGYEVEAASNALEAVSQTANINFDLVISDIRMPGENGVIAIEKIKKIYDERGHTCGFIFISGYAEEDTPAHAIRLGVDKFLFKPFDNNLLIKNIEEELTLIKQQRELKSAPSFPNIVTRKPFPEKKGLKRAVITGIGVVAPNGIGKEAYWKGLREGVNCVDKITFFDASTFPSKVAAEIRTFRPENYVDEKNEIKRMGRSSHLAIAGAKLCIQDAGISLPKTTGVILGSAVSGLEYVEIDFRALEKGGVKKVRPFVGIAGFAGAISSEISRALGIQGLSLTLSTGCTSSTDAMGYAIDLIRNGKEEILVSGGADACVTPGILSAFCQMGAASTWKNSFHQASRPFNKDRAGFVISEGAWIFLFEELKHALSREAKIYGEVAGYGATCDAWHMAKPHPSGEYTAKAICIALEDAGLLPQEIDLFETYGNGTPINDSYETAVIKKVFGAHAYKLLAPSIKSMLGHPLGASGAQQVAAVLMALQKGIVHPTINYEVPDPECDLNYVPNKAVKKEINAAVCSSIAFGAKNSSIILKKYKL